jgi:uncharacterized protein YkwD
MVCLKRVLGSVLLLGLLGACGGAAPRDAGAALPTARVILQTTPPTTDHTPSAPALASITPAPPTPSLTATVTPTPSPTATVTVMPTPSPTATAVLSPAVDSGSAALEAALVAAINQVRAANGLPPYLSNAELNTAAHAHSCDMAAHTMISHTSSDGRMLKDRLAGSGPPWVRMSESIAAGWDDPATVVAMWMDEPPDGWHRRNILDAELREVGTGYCYVAEDTTGNHYYWTADFALRSS